MRRVPDAGEDDGAASARASGSPRSAWGDAAAWDREYAEVRAIPASVRSVPSRALRRLEWSLGDLAGATVLDVGAGAGRHTVHLASRGARVYAIDSSDVACRLLAERVGVAGLAASVAVEHGRLDADDLPDGRFDLIVDSYASCHIVSAGGRRAFLDALMSRLARHGRLYTAGMGAGDSYYRRHLASGAPDPIAVDPLNDVPKLLQRAGVAARDGAELGRVVASTTERFTEPVAGRGERREVHASVLCR